MSVRTMGVEEELLLVDPDTGVLRPLSARALAIRQERSGGSGGQDDSGADIGHELFLHQVETATAPCETAAAVLDEIVASRRQAASAVEAAGAALTAVATPLYPYDDSQVTPKQRYERLVEQFAEVGRQAVVCGAHVHVGIADEAEGVRALDGMRPWLPVLRAISVNSPYWQGHDTGYASWRSQVWSRFPTARPGEPFGSPQQYHAATGAMIEAGAALDAGMLYLDARLARSLPTVEIRVFDVMTEPGDTVLAAMVTRALVDTVARQDATRPSTPWRTDLLRAAHWRAARFGLSGDLLEPPTGRPAAARSVVASLLHYVDEALEAAGDAEEVRSRFEDLVARGTGAERQRAAFARGGLPAVDADLRARFVASYS